jgi:hypothetical protein
MEESKKGGKGKAWHRRMEGGANDFSMDRQSYLDSRSALSSTFPAFCLPSLLLLPLMVPCCFYALLALCPHQLTAQHSARSNRLTGDVFPHRLVTGCLGEASTPKIHLHRFHQIPLEGGLHLDCL